MHPTRSVLQMHRPIVDHGRLLYWSSNSHWHVHPTSKMIPCVTFSNSRTRSSAMVRDMTRSCSTEFVECDRSVPSRTFSWVQTAASRVEVLAGKTSSESASPRHDLSSMLTKACRRARDRTECNLLPVVPITVGDTRNRLASHIQQSIPWSQVSFGGKAAQLMLICVLNRIADSSRALDDLAAHIHYHTNILGQLNCGNAVG